MQWKSHQQDGHRTKTTRNAEKPQNFDADAAGAAAGRQTGCPIITSIYALYMWLKGSSIALHYYSVAQLAVCALSLSWLAGAGSLDYLFFLSLSAASRARVKAVLILSPANPYL